MPFPFLNKNLIFFILFVMSMFGLGWYLYLSFEQQGYERAKLEFAEKEKKANSEIKKLKKKVRNDAKDLDRDAIVRELCANGWVRNPEDCPRK